MNLEIHGNVSLHLHNEVATVLIFGFAVAFLFGKAKAIKKSKTATVVEVPTPDWTFSEWLDKHGIIPENKSVTLFKRVSKDFKTQEGNPNETMWAIGSEVVHSKWNPSTGECGEGKFHACGRPYFCDEFRSKADDRYVAILVSVKDLHSWKEPQYPHKIAFRACKVLHECNKFGDKL